MTGAIVLVVAVAATAVFALLLRRRDGRFATPTGASSAPGASEHARLGVEPEADADPTPGASGGVGPDRPATRVTAEEVGGELGERLTFVQFSSAFCSPCRATRTLLADVVSTRPGVAHVEVDAESHLDLVRRLNVLRTPTVLVVGPDGTVVSRASGLPRREQVLAVLDAVEAR